MENILINHLLLQNEDMELIVKFFINKDWNFSTQIWLEYIKSY